MQNRVIDLAGTWNTARVNCRGIGCSEFYEAKLVTSGEFCRVLHDLGWEQLPLSRVMDHGVWWHCPACAAKAKEQDDPPRINCKSCDALVEAIRYEDPTSKRGCWGFASTVAKRDGWSYTEPEGWHCPACAAKEFKPKNRFTIGKQPCQNYAPQIEQLGHAQFTNVHQCSKCGGEISWCQNCKLDHHVNGYETCAAKGKEDNDDVRSTSAKRGAL